MWARFLWFFVQGDGAGHVQSLILGAVLFNAAMVLGAMGVLGDLLSAQRITLQRVFERVRRIELELGVPPSHYEPGQAHGQEATTGAHAGRAPAPRAKTAPVDTTSRTGDAARKARAHAEQWMVSAA